MCWRWFIIQRRTNRRLLVITAAIVLLYWIVRTHSVGHKSSMSSEWSPPAAKVMAADIEVTLEVISNLEGDGSTQYHTSKITLRNVGKNVIKRGGWGIQFFYMSVLEHNRMTNSRRSIAVADLQMDLTQLESYLYKLEPSKHFNDIPPGGSLEILLEAMYALNSRYSAFPNWLLFIGDDVAVIPSTAGEDLKFVKDFDTPAKWKRCQMDLYDPFTPSQRYERYAEVEDLGKAGGRLLPTPVVMEEEKGVVTLLRDWVVIAPEQLDAEAELLAEELGISVKAGTEATPRSILMKLGTVDLPGEHLVEDEAYTLNVDSEAESVTMMANKPAGISHATHTMLNILNPSSRTLPVVRIRDSPRFPYRGVMLDVSRNFQSKESMIKLLSVMSRYKLNVLHLHLTDDEGWRLEIPGLPELTQVGGCRGFDPDERVCLNAVLGTDLSGQPPGSGYYTVQDYRDILIEARRRNIKVIPEIDVPAHSRAAIISMQIRAKKLAQQGESVKAGHYILSDPEDKSQYSSAQRFTDNVMNPCLESTYNFLQHVVEQIIAMHKDILPLETLHIGGDELPEGAFTESPACQRFVASSASVTHTDQIREYFLQRTHDIVDEALGVQLMGWEDAFFLGKTPIKYAHSGKSRPGVAQIWQTVWKWGMGHRAYELANAGYQVVLSPATHLYMDHAHEPDPEERGLQWATRFIDSRMVLGFNPTNLYQNVRTKPYGQPYSQEDMCREFNCVKLQNAKNIIGMEAPLFGELLRRQSHMEEQFFPRLLAFAERAWHKADWEGEKEDHKQQRLQAEDWQRHANTVGYRELARLDRLDMRYRVTPPGVKVQGGNLMVNTEYPHQAVDYSVDEGATWQEWKAGTKISGQVMLTTRSTDSLRRSRPITVTV